MSNARYEGISSDQGTKYSVCTIRNGSIFDSPNRLPKPGSQAMALVSASKMQYHQRHVPCHVTDQQNQRPPNKSSQPGSDKADDGADTEVKYRAVPESYGLNHRVRIMPYVRKAVPKCHENGNSKGAKKSSERRPKLEVVAAKKFGKRSAVVPIKFGGQRRSKPKLRYALVTSFTLTFVLVFVHLLYGSRVSTANRRARNLNQPFGLSRLFRGGPADGPVNRRYPYTHPPFWIFPGLLKALGLVFAPIRRMNENDSGPTLRLPELVRLEVMLRRSFKGQHLATLVVMNQFHTLLLANDAPSLYQPPNRLWVWRFVGGIGLGKSHLVHLLHAGLKNLSCSNLIHPSQQGSHGPVEFGDVENDVFHDVMAHLYARCFNFVILDDVGGTHGVVSALAGAPTYSYPAGALIVVVLMTSSGGGADGTVESSVHRLNRYYGTVIEGKLGKGIEGVALVRESIGPNTVSDVLKSDEGLERDSPVLTHGEVLNVPFLPFHTFHVRDCLDVYARARSPSHGSDHDSEDLTMSSGPDVKGGGSGWLPYFSGLNMTQLVPLGCKSINSIYYLHTAFRRP